MPMQSLLSPTATPQHPLRVVHAAQHTTAVVTMLSHLRANPTVHLVLRNLGFILIWYILSTVLSLFNKKLFGKEHGLLGYGPFPAPLLMSAVQFLLQCALAKLVFLTGISSRTSKVPIAWSDYLKTVVPSGVTTGLDIGFSNMSLVYINLSFYTMCKSTVPVFLLLCAFIWRIERPSWALAGMVSVICVGLLLLVAGETEFDLLGFSLVMTASAMAGVRFTLTQVFLHGNHDAAALGSPLEVLEQLTPLMAGVCLLLSLVWEQLWKVLPASPFFASAGDMGLTMLVVLAGGMLAFLMVWTEYRVIKETSALTFMIAGTCKEVVTVVVAVLVMGDRFGPINGVGLGVVMLGVLLFNWYKYRRLMEGSSSSGGGVSPTWKPRGSQHHVKGGQGDAESAMELEPLVVAASHSQLPGHTGMVHLNGGHSILSHAGTCVVEEPQEAAKGADTAKQPAQASAVAAAGAGHKASRAAATLVPGITKHASSRETAPSERDPLLPASLKQT